MHLRETKRRNKDGSEVRYLQLAHNVRHPDTGQSTAKIIHNFGRADQVDRDALVRLVRSIMRELDPVDEVMALAGDNGRPVDTRRLGGTWLLDQLWRRLGIDRAIVKVARDRRVDAEAAERVLFTLVANRALDPVSKLDACRWLRDEVYVDGLAEVGSEACYRAMDYLLDALGELQQTVFFTVADLLSLEVDILFFDTTSTYFETEVADAATPHAPAGFRSFGKSKDHRRDRPQVVLGMAVTREGIPVRLWV